LAKKSKIKANTAFKVIQRHRGWYQSKAISRTVSELSQLIVQISDTLHFRATLVGLGTTYDVHLGLIGKHVVDFLLMLIELFSL